jgi:hypothetical protein
MNHTEGLIALSGCRKGEIAAALLRREPESALNAARRYHNLFGPGRFWLELQHHLQPDDGSLVRELVELAHHLGLGYVATNNVHYATRDGCRLQDVLVCIGYQTSLDEAGPLLRPNSEFYLKSVRQLAPSLLPTLKPYPTRAALPTNASLFPSMVYRNCPVSLSRRELSQKIISLISVRKLCPGFTPIPQRRFKRN